MRKRYIMIVSGGLAGLTVLVTCLLLIQSSEMQRAQNHVDAKTLAMPEAPTPPPASIADRSAGAASSLPSFDVAEPAAAPMEPGAESVPSTKPIAVSVPQLAYAYILGYRLPGPRITEAQQAHLALCQDLGQTRCQLIAMRNGSSDDGYANANLQLRVASSIAQAFRADLTRAIAGVGGRAAEASITADDVSKEIVDTEARIRQREILVARLTDMLRNRQGRVSELVEAERSVAAAQEELDQAKGWLTELRTRVAMSRFTVNYAPGVAVSPSPRPQSGRLGDAILASAGMVFAFGRNLLIVLIFALPWALIALAGAALVRRWYRRRAAEAPEA